jgi:hypothetical protein
MDSPSRRSSWPPRLLAVVAGLGLLAATVDGVDRVPQLQPDIKTAYASVVRPLIGKYCVECHSTKRQKGSLDLERFISLDLVRKDLKPWQQVIEMLEAGEMPPKNKPQPTGTERKQLIAWTRGFLDAEARARAGDPGNVPLRRLSNAEFDYTIRDLTGVDLRPTREFPADGAAGEGFTNAAEALTDISPTLLTKYLAAAKDIADHAVLLPDGFRFSPSKTRRDWTNESLARLRAFYAEQTGAEGRLPVQPYLTATVRHREVLTSGKLSLVDAARKEKLSPKYLRVLWQVLTDKAPSYPLDQIRNRWRQAVEKDVPGLAAEIAAWQAALWKYVPIGSYRYGNIVRQVANDPATSDVQSLRLAVKPAPGESEVVISLVTRDLFGDGKGMHVVWQRPRFERLGQPPLLLRDYARFGPAYEIDYTTLFSRSARYLAAVAEAAHDRKTSLEAIAKKHGLDTAFLKRWIDVLALETSSEAIQPETLTRIVPAVTLDLLDEKAPKNDKRPAVNGWRRKGVDLPVLLTNSSNVREHVPGRLSPHKVVVHPTPTEFVAVAWNSPVAGRVRIAASVIHAHPGCGNGIAWWLEHRRANRAAVVSDGVLDVGGQVKLPAKVFDIHKGDVFLLAVDARNGNHACDLTEIDLTITEMSKPNRTWDLAADVADSVLAGNPHADKHGDKEVWSFVRGPSRPTDKTPGALIPAGSLLSRWREAASDPKRRADAATLAKQVQILLTGLRPTNEKHPDRIFYDNLVSAESALFQGLDPTRLGAARPKGARYGLVRDRFGKHPAGKPVDEASLVVAANTVTEVRLPAALFRDRVFVVEGKLDGPLGERVVDFHVQTPPGGVKDFRWDGKSPVVASPTGAAYKLLLEGYARFRQCFPTFICFPNVVPTDEVVCLKMFHREDEPLERLFLDEGQKRRLDRLWAEHRFISQQPVAENKYLPLFIGFVTQDQPKELLAYFESQRPVFRKRAEEFERDAQAAIPKHLDALLDFASRAYRRPLTQDEKSALRTLYAALRKKGVPHEEAFRGILARVLVSPAFLFRIEQAPAGKEPGAVNDWELATRLSYFLWSTLPDEELRALAAAGRLRDPQILEAQARRMLKDDRLRALAIEFGTQWLHVRGFDELKEKNEKLFPTFDANLRSAIYEESIRFFQDLFQSDQAVTRVLDADYTFLNERLARHYGIPGVTGKEWRKVEGVKKYGRGGILALASVQTKESGASRTSPVLRGNWVVETLLGEKLPRPPPNVPRLPEDERGNDGLTMRQLVEKHTRVAACAVCHQRIDPFGFALEHYDAIGRLRAKDMGGLPVDSRAKLKDGTEFDGIEGLRNYLLTKKKDVIIRLFCRKLLGYALGRAVTLSDQLLIDEMVGELSKNGGRLSVAVLAIVRSKQFRSIRGSAQSEND